MLGRNTLKFLFLNAILGSFSYAPESDPVAERMFLADADAVCDMWRAVLGAGVDRLWLPDANGRFPLEHGFRFFCGQDAEGRKCKLTGYGRFRGDKENQLWSFFRKAWRIGHGFYTDGGAERALRVLDALYNPDVFHTHDLNSMRDIGEGEMQRISNHAINDFSAPYSQRDLYKSVVSTLIAFILMSLCVENRALAFYRPPVWLEFVDAGVRWEAELRRLALNCKILLGRLVFEVERPRPASVGGGSAAGAASQSVAAPATASSSSSASSSSPSASSSAAMPSTTQRESSRCASGGGGGGS